MSNVPSYVCGVSDTPLLGDTIGQALARAAARWPDRPALISPSHGVSWTWRELHERVQALAAGFLALGLQRGDRIGVWSLNRPEWTLTQFAAAEAGLIFVTVNPAYRLHELEYALNKVGCSALVVATRFKTSDYIGMVNALAPELASSTPGELCTRGYSVMAGYWDEPERTREAKDAAGWMHTGDLATVDAEGYGNIVGRIKDMVIRGGENIYPREIEEFLFKHPRIQDVQVFGVADTRFGEELCAWVRVKSGETLTAEEVRAFCEGQIAHYKIPRYVEFVAEFPMTISGKAQKYLMRRAVEEKLGLKPEVTA